MEWKGYRLVYRALSPVHIGSYTLGYVNLTRRYITGRAMWGAMTANLARTGLDFGEYEKCGTLLKTKVLMSYFFPALEPEKPFLPRFGENGLRYGTGSTDMTAYQFEHRFVRSMGQTAIDTGTWSAEDQTLHESEYLIPSIQDGADFKWLLFVGYLFVNEDRITEKVIRGAWSELFVGGDRKYGWGRLRLDDETGITQNNSLFNCVNISNCEETPKFNVPKDSPVPAHVPVNERVKLKGDIEPLLGLEYDNKSRKGFGHQVSENPMLCWVPGSVLQDHASLTLGPYGILE